MSDDSRGATRNRLVVEGEQLVLYSGSTGSMDLVSQADVRNTGVTLRQARKRTFLQIIAHRLENFAEGCHPVAAVWVPSGTYLILKEIPTSLQQRYGLEEEEGAVFLRPDSEGGTSQGELRFNNGALVQLHELCMGQVMEVLSLAGTQLTLYEPELQMK